MIFNSITGIHHRVRVTSPRSTNFSWIGNNGITWWRRTFCIHIRWFTIGIKFSHNFWICKIQYIQYIRGNGLNGRIFSNVLYFISLVCMFLRLLWATNELWNCYLSITYNIYIKGYTFIGYYITNFSSRSDSLHLAGKPMWFVIYQHINIPTHTFICKLSLW